MSLVLAADVGGTKTVLGLYRVAESGQLSELRKSSYASGAHAYFDELLADFLAGSEPPRAACFGIAGPIRDQRCETTNLPWIIDARTLASRFAFAHIRLLNDLEAAAYGMLKLAPDDFVELNPHARPLDDLGRSGHKAVIAAGTGLGEAILAWDGERHIVMPTEGGHTDFAPNDAEEDALLVYLRRRFNGHVSVERILSGAGFGYLYDFFRDTGRGVADPAFEAMLAAQDRNAVISQHGMSASDPLCQQVMQRFVRIYGAEAGNLALKCLPLGGLYIGGGIAPKIRTALQGGGFMQGFLDKGRMARAIAEIPVRLALNPEAPLLGAAYCAARLYAP